MFAIDLSGRVALVTGGSRGIGRAVALALASAGAAVAVTWRERGADGEAVVEECRKCGVNAIGIKANVAVVADVQQAIETTERELGPIDILVNNAGTTRDALLMAMSDEEWDEVLATNVKGAANTMRAVARSMISRRKGCIINMSSVAASRPGRGQANYAASKGAVESLTKAMAVELGSRGIRVNAVAPGVTETDMSRRVIELAKDEILQRQLIKRFATPAEIASWVVFLASDHAAFVTGEVIHVDGGMKMA